MGRTPLRPYLLRRGGLEPRERGLVVPDRELEGGGTVVVAVGLRLLRLLADLVERVVVGVVRLVVEVLERRGAVVLSKCDPQGDRVAQGLGAGRLREPARERARSLEAGGADVTASA